MTVLHLPCEMLWIIQKAVNSPLACGKFHWRSGTALSQIESHKWHVPQVVGTRFDDPVCYLPIGCQSQTIRLVLHRPPPFSKDCFSVCLDGVPFFRTWPRNEQTEMYSPSPGRNVLRPSLTTDMAMLATCA
jgi:hypothetical protein